MGNKSKEIKVSVNSKSTKAEIQTALKQALQELQKYETGFNAQTEKEKLVRKEILETADTIDSSVNKDSLEKIIENIINISTQLKEDKETANDNIKEMKEKYVSLCEALKIKEKEMKDLYGIDEGLSELTNLIQLYSDKKVDLENEFFEFQNNVEKQKNELIREYENKRLSLDTQYTDSEKKLKKDFDRKHEEFTYDFDRQKMIQENELNDKKEKVTNEINELRVKWSDDFAELISLQKRVENIPTEIKEAVDKAIEETKVRCKKSSTYEVTLLKKDFEGRIALLESTIANLKGTLTDKTNKMNELEQKLKHSYEEVTRLATTSMESKASYDEIETLKEILSKQNKDSK